MTKTDQFDVVIYSFKGDEEVKRMGPMSERKADKVEMGVLNRINLEKFYTVVEETKSDLTSQI